VVIVTSKPAFSAAVSNWPFSKPASPAGSASDSREPKFPGLLEDLNRHIAADRGKSFQKVVKGFHASPLDRALLILASVHGPSMCRFFTARQRVAGNLHQFRSSTIALACTRTLRPRIEFLTRPPDRIHPPDTIESTASPQRLWSSNVNLAGGSGKLPVRSGFTDLRSVLASQ
jgi:hypothetical protein